MWESSNKHLSHKCSAAALCSIRSDNRKDLIFRGANSHVDSVTPFRSMILSCQRSTYLINIQLRRRLVGYFVGIVASCVSVIHRMLLVTLHTQARRSIPQSLLKRLVMNKRRAIWVISCVTRICI